MPETQLLDSKFESLLDYLKRTRAFDFTGYKRSSLMRRVTQRMAQVDVDDYMDYIDYLEVHPDEFQSLFNTILINVTSFFRDESAWEFLSQEIVPRIISSKGNLEPIRVWCAGVASGEEAYSIAIIFAEHLQDQTASRLKIYATDIDDEALAQARQALYSEARLKSVSREYRDKYFVHSGSHYAFQADLRRQVIFGRHDLVQDAPISHIDLLICRNTLMYFNAETQSKILERFHYALNDHGYLFLGKAEMLLSYSSLFYQVDQKHRIFGKLTKDGARERVESLAQAGDPGATPPLDGHLKMREIAFDSALVPQMIVDAKGRVALINDAAKSYFGLFLTDIGRPFQDLEVSYRPVELRSLIEQVHREGRRVKVSNVTRRDADGRIQYFNVELMPLQTEGNLLGVSIAFVDVTNFQQVRGELERANQELETANEELQSAHEELETTNEELQSTNEELETTNEELQSTNEELETLNEELQSTNEELEATNTELRTLAEELHRSNSFLVAILSSLQSAVVVMDKQLRVVQWNSRAEELWGLRSDEVRGMLLEELDIGLPVKDLKEPLLKAIGDGGNAEFDVNAINRRGKAIKCKIRLSALVSGDKETKIEGLIMAIDEMPRKA
ncbi:MAG TPA: CheR family methyltransferase [Candidatus Obscuribacterales bacterium]